MQYLEACCGAGGSGTALWAGTLRVWFPMLSLEFFINMILPAILWPWGWLSLQQKWIPAIFPGGQSWPLCRADNFTTFMCQLSWNLWDSTSWKTQGLSRPVQDCFTFTLRHAVCHCNINMWEWGSESWCQQQGVKLSNMPRIMLKKIC